ncbi:hypothetical protein [Marinomonas fungiae]|uniref:hypothetical protein n=1 Tax=Marinomonas fungiae TaxID=1137284 RepID=UPI0011475F67|nr:hypothetical protein [Marinomonas fungiae]
MKNTHNEVKHPVESWARLNTNASMYRDIALQEAAQGIEYRHKKKVSHDQFEIGEYSTLAYQHAIKAIVFASMCVESGINDYAGIQLGDKYCEKHIYSMDVVSKWVLVPKLVCGNEIDKSGAAYKALKQLVQSRNRLVHNKSKNIGALSLELVAKLEKAEQDFESDFQNSFKALFLLSMEMDYVVGQRFNPIGTFDRKVALFRTIPEILSAELSECKRMMRNRKQ